MPETINIAIGMKAMVTQNIETDLDITNGARGTIIEIILNPDEPIISGGTGLTELQHLPVYILVKMDHISKPRNLP